MEANKYKSDFQFIGSMIKKFNINNNIISYNDDDPKMKKKLDVSHQITEASIHENEQHDKSWLGILNLNIKLDVSSNKQKTSISLLLEGCFSSSAEAAEDEFNNMLTINGVTTLYSIARSLILSITSQAYISGKISLPMFNVAAYSNDLNKTTTTDSSGDGNHSCL